MIKYYRAGGGSWAGNKTAGLPGILMPSSKRPEPRTDHETVTHPIITLTTDFGTDNEYVAAIKGVLLSRLASVQIIDISHRVSPGNVQQASYLLAGAVPYYPGHTVHTVVVDPGVGSERQILALEHSQGRFLGPDNGVLTPYLGGLTVIAVNRPDLYLDHARATFHGRDRFARWQPPSLKA